MPLITGNTVSATSGTSDWVLARKGSLVSITCTGWNAASVVPYFMVQNDTARSYTIKQSLGGSALSFTANDAFVVEATGYVYFIITGSPSQPVTLVVTEP